MARPPSFGSHIAAWSQVGNLLTSGNIRFLVNRAAVTPSYAYAYIYSTTYNSLGAYYDQYDYLVSYNKTFANSPKVCVSISAIKFRYCEYAIGYCHIAAGSL